MLLLLSLLRRWKAGDDVGVLMISWGRRNVENSVAGAESSWLPCNMLKCNRILFTTVPPYSVFMSEAK